METPDLQKISCQSIVLTNLKGNIAFCLLLHATQQEGLVKFNILRPQIAVGIGLSACAADKIGHDIHRLQRGCGRLGSGSGHGRGSIGPHLADLCQLFPCLLQSDLSLLHCQTLSLDLNIRQGGIVAEQSRSLFHPLSFGDKHFLNGLCTGEVDRLEIVGADGAVIGRGFIHIAQNMIGHRADGDRICLFGKIPHGPDQHGGADHKDQNDDQCGFHGFRHCLAPPHPFPKIPRG